MVTVQGAGDLLDRLGFDKMFPPDPADCLHNQHPPPPTPYPEQADHHLDLRGVNFERRITSGHCAKGFKPANAPGLWLSTSR